MTRVALLIAVCAGAVLAAASACAEMPTVEEQLAEFRRGSTRSSRRMLRCGSLRPRPVRAGRRSIGAPDDAPTELEQRLSDLETRFALVESLPLPEGAICEEC